MKIISNRKSIKLYKKVLNTARKFLEQPGRIILSLYFADKEEMQAINKERRGVDKPTDVLSFPTLELAAGQIIKVDKNSSDYDRRLHGVFIGDIAICEEIAAAQAEQIGHSLEREVAFLILHGFLHLLGYDHKETNDENLMRACQTQILKKVGLK